MTTALFIDSVDGHIYGLTSGWRQFPFSDTNSIFPFCFGNSMSVPALGYVQNEDFDWAFGNFSFTGTGLSLMGMVDFATFPRNRSLPYYVDTIASTIDGGEPQLHNLTTNYDTLMHEWFKVDQLSDGLHLLNLTQIPLGIAWDWAVIKPGPDMPIGNATLIVDDVDDLVVYNGNWEQSQEVFLVGTIPENEFAYHHAPYGGSTFIGRSVNDTLQFPFTGTSVSLYGFLRWNIPGNISLSFTIDNLTSQEVSMPIPQSSRLFQNETLFKLFTQPNFPIYTSPTIEAGNHVLTMNITNVIGEQSVIVDYIQYKPSFDTLATMPRIIVPSLNDPGFPQRRNGANVGAIVGSVIGGIAIVAIGLLGLFLFHRRRRMQQAKVTPDPFLSEKSKPPADIPTEAFLADISAPPPILVGKAKANSGVVENQEPPVNVVTPFTPGPSTAPPDGIEDEHRVQELERLIQRAAQENEFLVEGQVSPPAYADPDP